MELLGSTKKRQTDKNENGENASHLEITGVALIHCNSVNNDYQQDSRLYTRFLYTFVSSKSFGKLLDIWPKYFIFSKSFTSEFWYIKVWFTNQSSTLLEMEDVVNITSVIN